MSIGIFSSLVTSGAGVPGVCSRHGEPAVLRKRVRFISKPPGWTYALLLCGALPFLIAVMVLRKEVKAEAWPFCAQCRQLHKQRTLIGWGLLLPLVLLIAITFAGVELGQTGLWLLLVAIVACAVGFGFLARGGYRLLPQGDVAQDGSAIGFKKAHPAFAAEAQAAYERAAQQHAAQQQTAWQANQQQAQAQQAALHAAYAPGTSQQPPQA
ncbi:hypothetical protein ACFQFC_34805 [Amorphoplanes digitatis]|uniref:Uncharacterized protein n=1 Tax=Actinoplanes digitatis TaxID=1868 RepID=A0A7W7HVC2_9ACTN|nr:hypothetical protein [Actinoplanes digitatis]MBB4761336.1 hypothetical protein [Actinoplanes digitatis]GID92953.1 hypothetical protein Adi01nite_23650 [Actinoplanes digitatis]